ncbi:MAG: FAD-dependent oxidoreductase [Aquimonas sp.]|jgi:predicted NAD/FAD-binding protein|nr:FAD-dependent oxidoreductase [Xanthomonadales bacterium]MCC6506383.1 FAD-dependent oxidoreductase [Aquimonas sp.]
MRIAVVGSGIAGLGSAWLLSRHHDVVLFEADDRLGGHTHTHDIWHEDRPYAIDSGFIVHNAENYPLLTRLFQELGVATHATQMGFSVHDERNGLQYNASHLNGLFCQRRNLFSLRFWGMLRDIARFYRQAPDLLGLTSDGPTLGDYLEAHQFGAMFIHDHLVPMASALWSSPSERVLQFPAKYMVQFMANHHMLQAGGRPAWRVVSGGSKRYVRALESAWSVQVRLATPVRQVARTENAVVLDTDQGRETFDQVVLACHSDQALRLLAAPSEREHAILGAIRYQPNDTVLHTDARLLPPNRRAWAAWNAYVPSDPNEACTVSYCMNLLQGVTSNAPFVVTLNRSHAIDPARIIARMRYAHPEYTHASVAARARRSEINGVDRVWFCGAYWGWGFHEDGLRSAVDVAEALGARWGS